jgi:PAS domain S-box-containing protein
VKSPLRILLLEDNAHDAELIQELLEADHFVCEVIRVQTRDEFVAGLENAGIDLILADYKLPSFDGLSALKLALKARADLPFIFVSGSLGEEVAIEAVKIGATDYIVKSRLSRLVPAVQRALRETQERAERRKAEQAFRQSEMYLAEAQRLSLTGSFGWNPASGKIYWSDETYRIFQYEPGIEPTIQLAVDRTHPDDRMRLRQILDRASIERREFIVEHRLVMADGSLKHVRAVAHPSPGEDPESFVFVGALMDVTERKQAEEALRQSESYLSEGQRLSHTGSWAWVPARGEIRYWSEECSRIVGFDPAQEPPPMEEIFQRIHPDDRAKATEVMERAPRDRVDFTLDYRVIHPDGRVRDLHLVGHPAFNAAGDLAEFVGTVVDVTERKQAEQERQAQVWFLESMDKVNQAIQGTNDLEQMMSDVLSAVLTIFECDRAWLVYPCDPNASSWRPVMEHTRPGYAGAFALGADLPVDAEIAEVFQAAMASNDAVQFGSGSSRPVPTQIAERFDIQSMIAITIYPKVDRPYLFGLHQCSYPRNWVEREERLFQAVGRRLGDGLTGLLMLRNLRESEGKLEQAQRIAHVGYWDHDLDTDSFTWSDEAYRIFGLPLQEKGNTSAVLRARFHPEDWEGHVRATISALHGGPAYDMELRVVRPNGEVRIVHSRGDVTYDEGDRPRRVFGIIQDITERKQAEENLRESERRNREAQAELAHASRLTVLGELTASVAHEVNQPLTGIVTYGDACLRWLDRETPRLDQARSAVEQMIGSARHASDVIARIRALSRKGGFESARLDINQVIDDVIALIRREIDVHGISLRLELGSSLPPVNGDRIQLQQVVMNLLMNSIQAMSAATGRRRGLRIRSGEDESDRILVAVEDCGTGIEPEHVSRLFNAFFTTKPDGMGMGLSICRSIIEQHGGRIWATQNSPTGSTFQFTLPACRETGSQDSNPASIRSLDPRSGLARSEL